MRVLVLHFADDLGPVGAHARDDIVDAFDGEHHATEAQRVHRRVHGSKGDVSWRLGARRPGVPSKRADLWTDTPLGRIWDVSLNALFSPLLHDDALARHVPAGGTELKGPVVCGVAMGATKHHQPFIGQTFDEQRRERVKRGDDLPCGMILCNLD